MSVDKLVDSTQLNSDLTSVANAIRAKSGGSSQLTFPAGFVSEIGNIPSGGGALETGEVTIASDTDTFTAYVSQLYNRFCVIRGNDKDDWTYASTNKSVVFCYGDANKYTYSDTNNTGGGVSFGDRTPSWRNDKITFTATTITCKLLGNGVIATFPAGSVYRWFAWTEE